MNAVGAEGVTSWACHKSYDQVSQFAWEYGTFTAEWASQGNQD